ncbi:hypothetical protein [Hymenobacter daeguensis]
MLLFIEAAPATASPGLPSWLALPLLAVALLGAAGLFYSIRGLVRLFNPAENAFTLSAAQPVFRFVLTRAGSYEVGCTRPGRWGLRFSLPAVVLEVQALPAGAVQRLTPPRWSRTQRSSLSGDTTLRFATFRAATPGEYELRNPGAAQFGPGDQLRIIPDAGAKTVFFILAIIASAFALLGGGIVGLLALLS